jgi:hypothetical protein
MYVIPALRRLRQEDLKLKASGLHSETLFSKKGKFSIIK